MDGVRECRRHSRGLRLPVRSEWAADVGYGGMAEGTIRYLLGRFREPELERRFQQDVREVDLHHVIRVLVVVAFVYIGFLPIELVEMTSRVAVAYVIAARGGYVVLSAAFVLILRRPTNRIRTDHVVLIMVVAFCFASDIVFLHQDYMDPRNQGFMMATITFLMATLASYSLFPARFVYQLSIAVCFAVAFAILVWLNPPGLDTHLILVAMYFVATNAVGLTLAARIHELRRMQWMALHQERQLGAELKREIVQRQALEERLREQANTDPLTGVYNRRYFFRMGDEAMTQAQRYERPLSVILFDIDHFKHINDTYGHNAGDEVLKSVVGAISGVLRKPDVFCRHGGEEFSILLPESDAVGASRLAERIRSVVEDRTVRIEGKEEQVTISVGVAVLSPRDEDFGDLITRADDALYSAKRKGRNTVVCAV